MEGTPQGRFHHKGHTFSVSSFDLVVVTAVDRLEMQIVYEGVKKYGTHESNQERNDHRQPQLEIYTLSNTIISAFQHYRVYLLTHLTHYRAIWSLTRREGTPSAFVCGESGGCLESQSFAPWLFLFIYLFIYVLFIYLFVM